MEEIRLRARKVDQQTLLTWRSIVRQEARVTPRYFTEERYGIEVPLTDIVPEGIWRRRCLEPEIIASVFSGFSLSLLEFIHNRTSETQDWTASCVEMKESWLPKFGIVSELMKRTLVRFDDFGEWLGVEGKEYRAKHRSLRDSKRKRGRCWHYIINTHSLYTTGQIWRKPTKNRAMKSKSILKSWEQNIVIYSIKSRTEVKEGYQRN